MSATHAGLPDDPFTILEHQNPFHDVPELHKTRRSLDLETLKFERVRRVALILAVCFSFAKTIITCVDIMTRPDISQF